jgi:putative copper export protein/mono/diheme cytochrome c family protein
MLMPTAALVRWLTLWATAVLIGGFVLDLLVLRRDAEEFAGTRRRQRRWIMIAVVLLIAAWAGELVIRATVMSGSVASAVAVLPTVLRLTHFGKIWIGRAVILVLLLLVSLGRATWTRTAGLVMAAVVGLTTSLTGHSAARGDLTFSVLVDWAHVLAASAWVGGLMGLGFVVLAERPDWPGGLLASVAGRFSRLAGSCLAVVVASGVYNAWLELRGFSPLWTTAYGRVLAVKLLAVLALVTLGAINRYVALPHLAPDRSIGGIGFRLFRLARFAVRGRSKWPTASAPLRLSTYVWREAWLAILVLGLTAILGESTPGRHATLMLHRAVAPVETGPYRVTMTELHQRGGVPTGWIFAPPPGDAARGRKVFVALECFRCHAVRRAGFPPPSGSGPDLTGMGDHHPAGYFAESIMNPNAVIVEGPGYTGPDGRSIMPNYNEGLTIKQLADLVAYLLSLHEPGNAR